MRTDSAALWNTSSSYPGSCSPAGSTWSCSTKASIPPPPSSKSSVPSPSSLLSGHAEVLAPAAAPAARNPNSAPAKSPWRSRCTTRPTTRANARTPWRRSPPNSGSPAPPSTGIWKRDTLASRAGADRVPRDRVGDLAGDGAAPRSDTRVPGRTRLGDITVRPSPLRAPLDKIHPMPFPGLNIDYLPFFALIAGDRPRFHADPR